MTAANTSSASVTPGVAVAVEAMAEPARPGQLLGGKTLQRISLRPAGLLFSPCESLVWIIGLLGVVACIVPWFDRGWLWFAMIAIPVALLTCYDAISLWLGREECAPVLLPPDKGLRGREGEALNIHFALTGSARRRAGSDIRVAIMPATLESDAAIRVEGAPQRVKLGHLDSAADASTSENATQ